MPNTTAGSLLCGRGPIGPYRALVPNRHQTPDEKQDFFLAQLRFHLQFRLAYS